MVQKLIVAYSQAHNKREGGGTYICLGEVFDLEPRFQTQKVMSLYP